MLGGGKVNLIGNIIEQEFTVNSNWYLGSGLSLVMMVFIIVSMLIVQKFGDGEEDHYYEEILRKYVFDNNNALPVSADSNAHIPIIQREPFDVGIYEIFA